MNAKTKNNAKNSVKNSAHKNTKVTNNKTIDKTEAFVATFDEPVEILHQDPFELGGVQYDDYLGYYNLPVSFSALNKLFKASGHHRSCRDFVANMYAKFYQPSKALDYLSFRNACVDFASFGNCYFQQLKNRMGVTVGLKHQPAIPMRKCKGNVYKKLLANGEEITFEPGEIIHLCMYDPAQVHYGLPYYIGMIQSILLNEAATLFRRKYYVNGAHMGYIFFTNDEDLSPEGAKKLKKQIENSKGVGNFKSMFVHIPGGDENSVKLIPVGDKTTQDDFNNIKRVSMADILAGWRMYGELSGVQPEDKAGRGDIIKASRAYVEMEVMPVVPIFETINQYLPSNLHVKFMLPNTGIWEDAE